MQHAEPIQSGRFISGCEAGAFFAHHKAYGSGFSQDSHSHEAASIDLVLWGNGAGDCGRTRIQSVPGSVEYFPAEVPHDFTAGPSGIRTLHIVIPAHTLDRAGAPCGLAGQALPPETFLRPCLEAHRAVHTKDGTEGLTLESCVHELIALLTRAPTPRGVGLHARRAATVLRDRVTEPVTLGELSECVGVSPGHLAREFRRTHGVSIGAFQRGLRLRRAVAMLSSRADTPIARIAAACGFADQAH